MEVQSFLAVGSRGSLSSEEIGRPLKSESESELESESKAKAAAVASPPPS
jgi:hypothetical protein